MIKIENLSVKYDKTVLSGINLQFADNGIYCIYAPSGYGKTTLLNVIAGLVKYGGNVSVDGSVSYMFQEDRLLNWMTAEENIMFVEPSKEKAEEYMRLLGINEFKNKKPQELSGGMKRRCALVRCLAFEKDIYLLDEPFKGLDEANIIVACDILKSMARNKLIILVTHNEDDVKKLDAHKILL
jgi:NitT/TauT family transport system ATP-binding protein